MEALATNEFVYMSPKECMDLNGGWNLLNLAGDGCYVESVLCAAVGVMCPPVAVLAAAAAIAWAVDGALCNTAAGLYDNRKK